MSEQKKKTPAVRNTASKPRTRKTKPKLTVEEMLALIQKSLDDGKAQDISVIDLAGKTSIADFMVVASGTSQRQVVSLAERVALDLKAAGVRSSMEGKAGGEWVIVDALDIIVHVFYPETRAFYSIEDMWKAIPVPAADTESESSK
ncbi:MAG: ribosome silencing factor [Alphaproteobacteria bacterium]|nr:ribosome silencing factor [Alphaproteobacteria bacterium]